MHAYMDTYLKGYICMHTCVHEWIVCMHVHASHASVCSGTRVRLLKVQLSTPSHAHLFSSLILMNSSIHEEGGYEK